MNIVVCTSDKMHHTNITTIVESYSYCLCNRISAFKNAILSLNSFVVNGLYLHEVTIKLERYIHRYAGYTV